MIGDVETRTVHVRDGRTLCVEAAGGPSERPVLVNCGTPNSRHLFDLWLEDAATRGIQLISYDRPGYGGSTSQPGLAVADGAGDVQAIAEDFGIDRLAIWGFSGGGPYTLASAALLPELVVAAAVVGSVAPWEAPGLDYFTGMGQDNLDDVKLFLSDPEAVLPATRAGGTTALPTCHRGDLSWRRSTSQSRCGMDARIASYRFSMDSG